ncbi:thiol-disulfide oxidoreductase DCC family protein [Virgibacillus byunsanensis]|uniref:Thiol-disulfide oxidoreductase DCC family protein n=1 Tax=Virgibacillus byunsanensis TaxID=570945 RepID=A0ABW3LRB3_9BACI
MVVYYDSYCKFCKTSATLWTKIDWAKKLTFNSFRTLEDYPKEMEKELHVAYNGKWYRGYNALIQIAKMLPLMWPALPFMYLFKWIGLGNFLYRKIAENRKLVPVGQCDDDSCELHH